MGLSLVTGATAGIGRSFARRLAAEGSDLLLVARSRDRLGETAERLASRHGVSVTPVVADLSTEAGCVEVTDRISDTEIDLLVNNAGMGLATAFWENTREEQDRLLGLNVRAVMRLTHAVLPGMLARGRGDVINVASVAGLVPGDADAAYAASKAWVAVFSESLAVQLGDRGVRVSALCPGYTRTEIHERAGIDVSDVPEFVWQDADDVVSEALRNHRRGRVVTVPGLRYRLVVNAARVLPRALVHRVSRYVYRTVFRN
ncbi:SDR family NAD(P)-dependent oxidoreductase [Streptoalloteichus hindustanus]|uniref:Ketoreductase domain-containing protein n=1 Tax=Streptoalloteichus hindustanus TaxID=2017 RepID=A0A1M5EY85_STRHI|nr:SDR family NAD(P)-dependent oxidoreductase [Streptoalloteichus hindustanus]SHF84204.1 hypothetical protein SAMN05444320_105193 [Streptoalloteichus hindustanus]